MMIWQRAAGASRPLAFLGLALFFSPALPGFSTYNGWWNAVVVGSATIILWIVAVYDFKQWQRAGLAALGGWLIVAPWVLGFASNRLPTLVHAVIGVALAVLAIWPIANLKRSTLPI